MPWMVNVSSRVIHIGGKMMSPHRPLDLPDALLAHPQIDGWVRMGHIVPAAVWSPPPDLPPTQEPQPTQPLPQRPPRQRGEVSG
jgi:hypothetical protein